MGVVTIEGKIQEGQVLLPDGLHLPNRAKVYIVIPDEESEVIELPPLPSVVSMRSPRFANPKDATQFEKIVVIE